MIKVLSAAVLNKTCRVSVTITLTGITTISMGVGMMVIYITILTLSVSLSRLFAAAAESRSSFFSSSGTSGDSDMVRDTQVHEFDALESPGPAATQISRTKGRQKCRDCARTTSMRDLI